MELLYQHNPAIVLLCFMIAAISSYASVDLVQRTRRSQRRKTKYIWLVLGAFALGIGISLMHFIVILSHDFSHRVYYDIFLVTIAIVIAFIGCILSYWLVVIQKFTVSRVLLSGFIMGTGIAFMHYVGIKAIGPMTFSYRVVDFAIFTAIAVIISIFAFAIGFSPRLSEKERSWKSKLLFSTVMGVAITAVQFTGIQMEELSEGAFFTDEILKGTWDRTTLAWVVILVTALLFSHFFFSVFFEQILRNREVIQSTILNSVGDGVVLTDESGKIIQSNLVFQTMMQEKGLPDKAEPFCIHDYYPHIYSLVAKEKELILESGSLYLEVKRYSIQNKEMNFLIWIFHDITDRIQAERHVKFLAYHDTLTELPNRYHFNQELSQRMKRKEKVACIYMDLDQFKFTNDILGHRAGDLLLIQVSNRIASIVNKDMLLSRFGGDEFVMLVTGESFFYAEEIAEQIMKEMNAPFSVDGKQINTTVSIGIATFPKIAESAEELVQFADFAMYESKQRGKNQVTIFSQEVKTKIHRYVQIEEAFISSMENNAFYLLYQPKFSVKTQKIEGVEALLRWNHPTLGNLTPGEFIPIAEEKGFIDMLGEWVLEQACKQWKTWAEENNKEIVIAVNVSMLQFAKLDFLPKLEGIIQKTGMDPHFLELEMTESASITFGKKASETLQEIKRLGVRMSLDDFGTGYSSLKYLNDLPIEVLKIDKSFLDEIIGDVEKESIVKSIIQLGHNMNMKVLMEGVETEIQMNWLEKEGCDSVQGFLLSKPLLPDEIMERFEDQIMDPELALAR